MKSLILSLFLIINTMFNAKLIIHDVKFGKTLDINIYNGYPWEINPPATSSPIFSSLHTMCVVRIDKAYKSYNPCDYSTFTFENIEPLLQKIAINTPVCVGYENGWVAMIASDSTLIQTCGGISPFHLLYSTYAAVSVQKLGSTGMIYLVSSSKSGKGSGKAAARINVVPPNIDLRNHQILQHDMTIISLLAENYQIGDAEVINLSSLDYQWVIPAAASTDKKDEEEPARNESVMNKQLKLSNITGKQQYDWNPYTNTYEVFGLNRLHGSLFACLSFLIGVFIILRMRKVIAFFKDKTDPASKVALRMRLMILIPELINAFFRVPSYVDAFGGRGVSNFFIGTILVNFTNALSLFTDITCIIYCCDVSRIFKASRMLRSEVPLLTKYKSGLMILLSVALVMVVVQVVLAYFGLIGQLGPETLLLPSYWTMLANLCFVVASFKVSCVMKNELKNSRKQLASTMEKEVMNQLKPSSGSKDSSTHNNKSTNGGTNGGDCGGGSSGDKSNRGPRTSSVDNHVMNPISSLKTKKSRTVTNKLSNINTPVTTKTRQELHKEYQEDQKLEFLEKIGRLFRLRRYIQLAVYARILTLVAVFSFASGFAYQDPLNLDCTIMTIASSALLTSLFQVLAARQLPSKKSIARKIAPRY